MRDIKFRAWDKEVKEMIDWNSCRLLPHEENVCHFFSDASLELMQYTGLKDK